MTAVRNVARWIALVGVTLVLCVVLLIAGEFGLRWWYSDITTTADNSSWFSHRWHKRDIGEDQSGLNSLRFRDQEWDVVKPSGTYRIAIVGDSFTYGQGIDRDARFGERLADLLKRDAVDIEVMNLGKPGASARQNAFHLRMVEQYKPDFVLIQFTPNDFDDSQIQSTIPRGTVPNLVSDRRVHDLLHRRSALYYIVNSGFGRLQSRAHGIEPYPQWLAQRFSDAASAEGKIAREHMMRLLRVARRLTDEVGVVAFPMLDGPFDDAYAYAEMHRIAEEVTRSAGVAWLDLLPKFAAYQGDKPLMLSRFDGHPNDLANKIAAEGIAEHFAARWKEAASR